jgi:hypothetical protein
MSDTEATITARSPLPRETLLARFMQRFATPLTTGLFLVSTVSGVALFFHWQQAAFHSMHEWLSMVLLAPFVFHLWKNWRALVVYARRGTLIVPLAACVVVAVPFAYNSLTSEGRRGGNPGFQAISLLTQAPLSDLAPLLHQTPDALIETLKQKGYQAGSTGETLASVAAAAGKQPFEALTAIMPNRRGR